MRGDTGSGLTAQQEHPEYAVCFVAGFARDSWLVSSVWQLMCACKALQRVCKCKSDK